MIFIYINVGVFLVIRGGKSWFMEGKVRKFAISCLKIDVRFYYLGK